MLPQGDNDKSRDFRGEWKTRDGYYALVIKPVIDSKGFLRAWKGHLYYPDGKIKLQDLHVWGPSGCSDFDMGMDLMERKRGNETNWPNLQY